jgi:hypothetical protein
MMIIENITVSQYQNINKDIRYKQYTTFIVGGRGWGGVLLLNG